ncbi:MAG: lytic transglycosylase domain-containing protein [Chlorobi bacterium]|nr:lytic transglycosylase domain-containing protein [Chlorobiota bacterium]
MKKNKFWLPIIILLTLVSGCKYLNFKTDENPQVKVYSRVDTVYITYFKDSVDFPNRYKIFTPPVPKKASFAGERVPLANRDVYERFEREIIVNTYWHSATLLYIKRAKRWLPVIEPILKRNGIPEDFKYISIIESGLDNVTSPAKAVGFWQFLKGTGKKYGLEINEEVDERYDVEKATEAACKYFWDAYLEFGSWTLAAASYNMGINGARKQVKRQKSKNYYNLVLSIETARYIFRALALKQIMNNPKKYGFDISEDELYRPYEFKKIIIRKSVKDFADFAKAHGINYRILKIYNPWLRTNFLKNRKHKSYVIKLPAKIDSTVLTKE